MKQGLFCVAFALLAASCGLPGGKSADHGVSLKDARKGFVTHPLKQAGVKGAVPEPPPELFRIVSYPTAIGNMSAYLSKIPDDGKRHPAMIWIIGGWGNDIGDVWSAQEPENDQSAAVIREAGIVMMYPSLRGGNENPGTDETCYGEIDDIVAAAKYLAQQPGIDPKRIYLGGHSTGGTKVILAAEYSNLFRAAFSFGAAAAIDNYDPADLNFDPRNEQELKLRSPVLWLHSLTAPLFVFEGAAGNYDALKALEHAGKEDSPLAHFFILKGKDHFSTLQPTSRIIAAHILADTGSQCTIRFSKEELQAE
ncbi:alpha/beta hydrolase family protein [Taibaiella koreensis]|uniref:alpha/beta hydrolase family protein n=1 Tax=Taibaiella koreensis TaxID=1268548 RepID=UPI00196920F3|nr:prolyl oligopeptidase family serine peptidase [Taibaiella koreensis]